MAHGFPVKSSMVIYPGVRDDMFDYSRSGFPLQFVIACLHESGLRLGSASNPEARLRRSYYGFQGPSYFGAGCNKVTFNGHLFSCTYCRHSFSERL